MIALWLALVAGAHPLAPSVLRVDETGERVEATWRTPVARPVGSAVTPVLPCPPIGEPLVQRDRVAVETTWTLDCATAVGQLAGADGLAADGTQVLVDHRVPGGGAVRLVDPGTGRVWLSPGEPSARGFRHAVGVGVWHLVGGLDHVLFVIGLALAVPVRRLVGAISAFTVGHGISLAVAGTGLWVPPAAPVEVGIALSLVWLAAEITGDQTPRIAEWPVLLCLPFGLLHGLGFAGAWLESGLATGELVGALLGFNLGIELAQLAMVAVLLAGWEWFGRPQDRTARAAAWVGGAVAGLWVWERVLGWLAMG